MWGSKFILITETEITEVEYFADICFKYAAYS